MAFQSNLIEPTSFTADLQRPGIDMVTFAPTISFTLSRSIFRHWLYIDFDCADNTWSKALKHIQLYRDMDYTPVLAAVAEDVFAQRKLRALNANVLGESTKERFIKRLFGMNGPWRIVGDYYSLDLSDPSLQIAA